MNPQHQDPDDDVCDYIGCEKPGRVRIVRLPLPGTQLDDLNGCEAHHDTLVLWAEPTPAMLVVAYAHEAEVIKGRMTGGAHFLLRRAGEGWRFVYGNGPQLARTLEVTSVDFRAGGVLVTTDTEQDFLVDVAEVVA